MSSEKSAAGAVGRDLTEGPVFKTLLAFSVPLILTSLIQQLYSMTDLIVIGQYAGNTGTVAVSTGSELMDFMLFLSISFSSAGQIYISQLAGAKDRDNIRKATGTLFIVVIIMAAAAFLIAVVFYRQLLGLINCPEEAWDEAASYLLISAVGLPFVFGYNAIVAVLRSIGESRRPLYFVLIAAVINVFLDILLVAVFGLGAAGTAIATVAAQAGSFVASFIFFYKYRAEFDFSFSRSFFRVDRHALFVLIQQGVPYLIRSFSVQGSMIWVKSQVNLYGVVASTTFSVGNKIDKLMFVFVSAVSGGCGNMIGQNIGARKIDRVGKTLRSMLLIGLGFVIIVSALFLFVPKQLFSLFTKDQEVIEAGVGILRIFVIESFIAAFSSTYKSMSQGAGAAGLCLVIGILDGVCRIGWSLLFKYGFGMGLESYYWGTALCMLIPGIVSLIYYLSGTWKNKKLLSEQKLL